MPDSRRIKAVLGSTPGVLDVSVSTVTAVRTEVTPDVWESEELRDAVYKAELAVSREFPNELFEFHLVVRE